MEADDFVYHKLVVQSLLRNAESERPEVVKYVLRWLLAQVLLLIGKIWMSKYTSEDEASYLAKGATLHKFNALKVALAGIELFFHQNRPLQVLLNLFLQLQNARILSNRLISLSLVFLKNKALHHKRQVVFSERALEAICKRSSPQISYFLTARASRSWKVSKDAVDAHPDMLRAILMSNVRHIANSQFLKPGTFELYGSVPYRVPGCLVKEASIQDAQSLAFLLKPCRSAANLQLGPPAPACQF